MTVVSGPIIGAPNKMNAESPMSRGSSHSNQSGKEADLIRSVPPWRWAWIGIAASAVLWFGSSTYFQKSQQYREVNYQTGYIEEAEYDAAVRRDAKYAIACKVVAGSLCLASLLYLVSRIDPHRRRPTTHPNNE